jgi:hypothetical protein
MGRVPQLDPDQVAVLRRMRAAFGPIEILEVIDRSDNPDQADAQGALVNHEALPKESRGGHHRVIAERGGGGPLRHRPARGLLRGRLLVAPVRSTTGCRRAWRSR